MANLQIQKQPASRPQVLLTSPWLKLKFLTSRDHPTRRVQLAHADWPRADRPWVCKDSQARASPNPSGGRRFAATSARDNFVYTALKGKRRRLAHASHDPPHTLSSTRRSKRPARDPEAAAMATVSANAATSVVARAALGTVWLVGRRSSLSSHACIRASCKLAHHGRCPQGCRS